MENSLSGLTRSTLAVSVALTASLTTQCLQADEPYQLEPIIVEGHPGPGYGGWRGGYGTFLDEVDSRSGGNDREADWVIVGNRAYKCDRIHEYRPPQCKVAPSVASIRPNGCTAGPDWSFGSVHIGAACRTHDLCYSTVGARQSRCDRALRSDIDALCDRNLTGARRLACRAQSDIYYLAVDAAGGSFFESAQRHASCAAYFEAANQCGAKPIAVR